MKIVLLVVFGVLAVSGEESQNIEDFAAGNVQFSADVYKQLSKTKSGNFLVCPISAQVMLALAHAGAGGNTAKQLSTGLRLPQDKSRIQDIFRQVTSNLNVDAKYILTSANKIYLADRFKINNDFNNTAVNIFGADTEITDFLEKEQAANQINQWVEGRTQNKIKNLIKPNYLTANTVAILVNALYFKGNWVNQFDPRATKKESFFVSSTEPVDTDMMTTVEYFNYYESEELGAQFLELPYEGEDITMTIVLPTANDGLPGLEDRISEVLIAPKYRDVEVVVNIPKYTIETDIPFKAILEELGIVDAFTRAADFSGMTANEHPVHISNVIQKTFIEVHEKGTTAAASTAILFVDKSIPGYIFNANHPFLFFLKHRFSGILFIGRFVAPESSQ